MKIYIDGEKLMESFYDTPKSKRSWSRAWWLINHAKLSDVRENVRGEWIRRDSRYVGWISFDCSVCGETLELDRETSNDFKYCPFCGAQMRGDNNV